MTIAQLKSELVRLALPDDTQIEIAVQTYTRAWPDAYPEVWSVSLDPYDSSTVRLHCTLPEGMSISKRK